MTKKNPILKKAQESTATAKQKKKIEGKSFEIRRQELQKMLHKIDSGLDNVRMAGDYASIAMAAGNNMIS